jgi:ribosomal protein S18 acetylase RimI-like enzyme
MQGITQCFLEVAEDNIAAQQFYERFDFTQFSRRKKYYQRPDSNRIDAILMRRIFV